LTIKASIGYNSRDDNIKDLVNANYLPNTEHLRTFWFNDKKVAIEINLPIIVIVDPRTKYVGYELDKVVLEARNQLDTQQGEEVKEEVKKSKTDLIFEWGEKELNKIAKKEKELNNKIAKAENERKTK
jgi:hypothetical protein